MAAILRSGRSFKTEVVPEIESYTKIGHVISCVLRFCSTFYLKYWRSYGNFKIWPIFSCDDVINDVINTKNYTDLARPKTHICVKFGVDCFNGATGIVNITDKQTDRQTDRWKGNRRLHTCQNYLTEIETETWLTYPHVHVYILHFSFCLV